MTIADLPPLSVALTTPEGLELYGFSLDSQQDAVAWWWRLRSGYPDTGMWPLITDGYSLERLADRYRSGPWRREPDSPPTDEVGLLAAGVLPVPVAEEIGTWPDDDEDEGWEPDPIGHQIFSHGHGPANPFIML